MSLVTRTGEVINSGKNSNAGATYANPGSAESAYSADVVALVGAVAAGPKERRGQEGPADGGSADDRRPGDEEDA